MTVPERRNGDHDPDDLDGMLQVARFHREHERFHSMKGLQDAADLRRESNALKVLADTWFRAAGRESSETARVDYQRAEFRAAGCEDLSDPVAVATTGILFMEGEQEPRELVQLQFKLAGMAEGLGRASEWLGEKMVAGFERESVLLTPELARAARPRFMALKRTSMTAAKFGVISRLLRAALGALQAVELKPAAIRKDLEGAAELMRTASWLLDAAAALLAEQAADLAFSDVDWTTYVAELEAVRRSRAEGAAPTEDAQP